MCMMGTYIKRHMLDGYTYAVIRVGFNKLREIEKVGGWDDNISCHLRLIRRQDDVRRQ